MKTPPRFPGFCHLALVATLSSLTSFAEKEPPNLVALAANTPELSTLVAAVQAAGLVKALVDDDFTVLAPTNDVFEGLPAGVHGRATSGVTGIKKSEPRVQWPPSQAGCLSHEPLTAVLERDARTNSGRSQAYSVLMSAEARMIDFESEKELSLESMNRLSRLKRHTAQLRRSLILMGPMPRKDGRP